MLSLGKHNFNYDKSLVATVLISRYTVVQTQPVHWDAASTATFQELGK